VTGKRTGTSDPLAETAIDDSVDVPPRGNAMAETMASIPQGEAPITAEAKLGRFVIVEKIGRGGMGVVYAAYDPQLDRRVAIKMLHDGLSKSQGARLEREARAMAQLNHPNVVTVHETGTFEGRLYIAMEYVNGETFGDWLRAQPRTADQILDLLLQAGKGLVAAHAVGLVHRDFKPENVLVGFDGRVRVSDFGLVTVAGESVTVDGKSPASLSPAKSPSLTVTGAVMGTPLYMAPEQHGGQVADAKADQFSFCVTLWQSLCNEPPYGADTYEDLVANVTNGRLRPVPRAARVSAKLRDILIRGLDADPAKRFPSMQALLTAIERSRRTSPWLWAIPAGVGVALCGFLIALALGSGDNQARDTCAGMAARLGGVWDPARKAKLAGVFTAVKTPTAPKVWDQVSTSIDRYTDRWVTQTAAVCRATNRGTQSAEALDLRMRCYDARLHSLDVLLGRFAEAADRDAVYKALDAATALPDFTDCDAVDRLRAAYPLPSDAGLRAQIAALDARLAEAESFDKIGRHAKARELVIPIVGEAVRLGYPPLEARAVLMRAGEELRAGDLAAAEVSYREAAAAAARARDDGKIAQSWIDLMNLLAQQGRYDDALALVPIARTSAERVSDQPKLGARFHNALAGIHYARGNFVEARPEYERALELVRKDTPDSELLGPALMNLGITLWRTGDLVGAEKHIEASRARMIEKLGPRHPMVAYVHRNLGDLAAQKNADGAIAQYEQALGIFEETQGKDHIDVAIATEPLIYAYTQKADYVKAREFADRTRAIREAKLGKDHISLAQVYLYLAEIEFLESKPSRGTEQLARALVLQEKAYGQDHVQLANTLDQMMKMALAEKRNDVALAHATRAHALRIKAYGGRHLQTGASHFQMAKLERMLDRFDAAFGDFGLAREIFEAADPKDPDIATALYHQAEIRAKQRRHADAIALFIKASETADKLGVTGVMRAAIDFGRAQSLWATGKRPEATALATAARAALDSVPDTEASRQEIDRWLASHR
jgi:tetratricopeptide (TPR) repeat protein